MSGGVVSNDNFVPRNASVAGMKKTAGELIEKIPVEEKFEGSEIRVVAWCPICRKQFFSSAPGTIPEMRSSVVNTAVTHIRCFHPED